MKSGDTNSEQSRRFIEAAHEFGCDEDEETFKAKVKGLATMKPSPLKSLPKRPYRKRNTEKTDDAGSIPAASTKATKGA